jgi:hypothetical protein
MISDNQTTKRTKKLEKRGENECTSLTTASLELKPRRKRTPQTAKPLPLRRTLLFRCNPSNFGFFVSFNGFELCAVLIKKLTGFKPPWGLSTLQVERAMK